MREDSDPADVWRLSRNPSLRVAVPTVASLLLGVLFVGRQSFWYDESFSVTFSRASLTQLWSQFGDEANMALYYVVLHFWLTLGDGEVMVRLLSVALAAAVVPAGLWHHGSLSSPAATPCLRRRCSS